MDDPIYILYSPRSHGWFTLSSTYASDVKEAKRFSRDAAIATCKKHRSAAGHNMIPIRLEDIEAI